MAYPHVSQTAAATAAAIQAATGNSVYAPSLDACNNMLSGLAAGYTTPIGTPIMFANVLVVCTAGYTSGAPVYSYDASTIQ
jgi:hypothetical protein